MVTTSKINLTLGFALCLLGACQQTKTTVVTTPTSTPAETIAEVEEPAISIVNPVLAGDFPDPSITKVGDTYWATATSSNWGPMFPLLKSTNLTDWELAGHVFPKELPAWADYYFWAPEISQEGNKTYIYYTAHKKGGNLAVAVAVADNPAGPYRDLGPLVGQEVGSIDGFPMRDEKGELYLIWKEDGNSRNLPTPIWAQRLNDEHTALLGEKKELFRNTAPWEGNLVEGVSMIKRNEYFYAFYAANGCCGHTCTYGTGIARAKSLLGPWEKYEKNPILTKNDKWACPGHGTVFNRGNRWYMLHHAYDTRSFEFVGRQGVLSEFTWTADGWPEFRGGSVPANPAPLAARDLSDEFDGPTLLPSWQWPVEERPTVAVRGGQLQLTARPQHSGAVLGQHTTTADYTATTTLLNPATLPAGTVAGIAAHGDPENTLALTAGGGKLQLWQLEKGKQKTISETKLPTAAALTFRLKAENGNQFRFDYSADNGKTWQALPAAGAAAINGAYLPPWDRGVRVGVLARGPVAATATFERFALDSQ
ncbi:family 43 glycosylhydrolase [uncultured Hymenobacter sp.]|uniref:family 43 glycosylhydrolase n=1 Tax=uncultured Hymenobacter sp. TaxID=170016 RepID=UPI0035CB4A46